MIFLLVDALRYLAIIGTFIAKNITRKLKADLDLEFYLF